MIHYHMYYKKRLLALGYSQKTSAAKSFFCRNEGLLLATLLRQKSFTDVLPLNTQAFIGKQVFFTKAIRECF